MFRKSHAYVKLGYVRERKKKKTISSDHIFSLSFFFLPSEVLQVPLAQTSYTFDSLTCREISVV